LRRNSARGGFYGTVAWNCWFDRADTSEQKFLAKRILRRILRERCRVWRLAFALSRFELVRDFYSFRHSCSLSVSRFRHTFMNGYTPAQIAPLMNV